jgi:plastocyanin
MSPSRAIGSWALAWALVAVPLPGLTHGGIEGRVSLAIEGLSLADVGPIVVYLEPAAELASRVPAARGTRTIRQSNAHFAPGFLAVAAGQTVDMPNDDDIYHNVFSYSKGNAFDLGLYAAGTSRRVTFENPGAIKIYCSIHESMNATVFVAPTAHFALVGADGRFRLRDVPAGRWRLRSWCERLPESARELVVEDGRVTRVEAALGVSPLESTSSRP